MKGHKGYPAQKGHKCFLLYQTFLRTRVRAAQHSNATAVPMIGLQSESTLIARKCWGCGEWARYGVAL